MRMAVMFSDIRDFTGFSEGRDPEFVVQKLNDVLGIQAEIVSKHGGDVDKFIGDAMVAWFTGPDRCQRAIQAAQEMMARLSEQIGDCGGARVGVGVHVGELIVGAIGSRERMDYTAIGSTVNLAARLCSAAQGGQILMSHAVVREVGSDFDIRPVSTLSLKGFAEPIPVYEAPFPHRGAAPETEVVRKRSTTTVN
jgi:adenylate cyclase